MDHESLRTASTYLNNLLLARGLLRNSAAIDFVKPSKESRAQIINLVHDLILRDDREKATRERNAEALRAAQAEDQRKGHELERVRGEAETAARQAVAAQTGERAARAELAKAEKTMKALQEQAGKLRGTLAQVRAQCATDVRKRELELARLKTHLQGQQRGSRVGAAGPSLVVHNRQGVEQKSFGGQGRQQQQQRRDDVDVADPAYSLRQETTEFLTELSQSLSDENDGLIGLIRSALGTMRELLGLPANERGHPDSAIGSLGSEQEAKTNDKYTKSKNDNVLQALPTSYEALSADVETALSHLKELLTTPNYVSVEEVEVREEEITRLRAGWDRMEQRWHEVLQMMEGWRKRMDTGDTINIDEIRRGIGLVSPASRDRNGELPEPEQSFMSADVSEIRIDGVNESSILALSSPAKATSKRKRDVLEPPGFFDLRPSSDASRTQPIVSAASRPLDVSMLQHPSDDGEESEDLAEPHMTVDEKLSAAQAEAEEAAAAARSSSTHAASKLSNKLGLDGCTNGANDVEDDTLGKMPSPMAKRTRIKGRPRKRKSTLSPEELEALLATDAGF